MSTKFEQLLDYLVNEEMDKANELFHEIVVEKSREIYENLIADEEDQHEESVEEADDDQEESVEEGDMDLEDSYNMPTDEAGDPTDDLLDKVEADDETVDDEMPGDEIGDEIPDAGPEEPSEDEAMMDIKNAIAELEAAFAELEASKGDESDDDFDVTSDDEEPAEMMGMPTMEGKKRITREYKEKVGNDWTGNSQKAQGKAAGADTGDGMGSPSEGKSVVASGKNKPGPAGVGAGNIAQGAVEGQSNTGTSPGKVTKGLAPHASQKMASGMHNVDGVNSGVKTLSAVKGGHGPDKKGSGPSPVGAGTGDHAGQTSIASETKKQFLKPYSK